jgi:hypothetical protein
MDVVRVGAKVTQGLVNHPVFGEINLVQTVLVDEVTGKRLPDGRLMELHEKGRAVGYCVKIRGEMLTRTDLPDLCVVEDVREGEVLVGGNWLSLADFHKYYEPD